jgi:aldehyde dehydrogenase (NAD+)
MVGIQKQLAGLQHPGRFFIGGEWVAPSSESMIDVVDSGTEEVFLRVAEAKAPDMARAIAAARRAFDAGSWPRTTPTERSEYLRALGAGLAARAEQLADVWIRESGVVHTLAQSSGVTASKTFAFYADMAATFDFEEDALPTTGAKFALLCREPVGVVGAIVPWNAPLGLLSYKIAPALLAGCTVVLKASPEAPGEAYIVAEIAAEVGLPPGVLNVVTAEREVSELLVRDPAVDKITFTGSTAAGRRIASLCGERIARCTLELGGKSAAVILDDADLQAAAGAISWQGSIISGQSCCALTRIIVSKHRHDEFAEILAAEYSRVRVGNPFNPETEMGPLAVRRQRDRVEGFIASGRADGAKLVVGGGRPDHLDRGWFIEPTVFANVDNSSAIAQEEIFGPVLSVIAADDEENAAQLANDTIYGLNAAVFTPDDDRALAVARRLRSGTVGHNAFRTDFGIAFGGFKQSGIGREGGREGMFPFLESKTVLLDGRPSEFSA